MRDENANFSQRRETACDSINIDDFFNSGIDVVIKTQIDQYRPRIVLGKMEYFKEDKRK
ncbi:hypothetical protein [Acetivibrio straminisolvens]|uniref:Uncharacterized protein n=1 Tax=Acetivibrio straminisolvens JCM 21531 TaxID=1294263 RepID=W4V2L3_9FIRM|nr:hypothetical protein [Acetivibrio straminisolvens]GAE87068.1 hypothetical protein JCM21531_410 [Acetivibrio straminisolvens JCM 21531]